MRSKLTACLAALSLAVAASTHADMIDQRTQLINKYVNEMHADPLVADCAAHGNFIASTSGFDHVDFPAGSFDSGNAAVTPWNNAFDTGKQRVTVDNVVTVSGVGARGDNGTPYPLKFRCGYVGTQLLAFSWNDPSSGSGGSGAHSGGEARHGHAHGKGRHKKGATAKHGSKKAAHTTKHTTTTKKVVKKSTQAN